jgi:hypothetical protein
MSIEGRFRAVLHTLRLDEARKNRRKIEKMLALFQTFAIILNWHILAPVKRIGAISPRGGER